MVSRSLSPDLPPPRQAATAVDPPTGGAEPALPRRRTRHSDAQTNAPDQGLSLLQSLLDDPLGYQQVHPGARKRRQGKLRSAGVFAFAVMVAFVLTVSARVVLANTDPAEQTRNHLIQQVRTQEDRLDQLSAEVRELKGAAAILLKTDQAVRDIDPEYLRGAQANEVTGSGITVTLSEAAGDQRAKDRVTDGDLRILTNQLWQGGAEAVSVNDHRLGAMTAIRTAGGTVLVDFRPIEPPYVVSAIGDPELLTHALKTGQAGQYFQALHSVYGISLQIRNANDLHFPPAQLRTVKSAHTSDSSQE